MKIKKLGILYAPRDSASAAALCRAVPLYRYGPDGFRSPAGVRAFNRGAQLINWGASRSTYNEDRPGAPHTLNYPFHVQTALSKLKTLTLLKNASIPALEATGEASVAQQWWDDGSIVLCRRDGLSGGRGIYKAQKGEGGGQLRLPCDFFVKYWKKTHEYRIHVFNGAVIDIQQKRRRTNWEGTYDPMIRNFDNGWVFCHDNIKGTETEITAIGQTAIMAVAATGLDFGAVDILARFNDAGVLKKQVVCEINTAPGLEGQTLEKYVTAIRNYLTQEGL